MISSLEPCELLWETYTCSTAVLSVTYCCKIAVYCQWFYLQASVLLVMLSANTGESESCKKLENAQLVPRFHPMPHKKVNRNFQHFRLEKYKAALPNKKVRLSQGTFRLPVSQFQSQTKSLYNAELEEHLQTMQPLSLMVKVPRVGY